MSALHDQLHALAAHVRDPAAHAGPPGIEDRRLAVYRELVFNNLDGLLAHRIREFAYAYDFGDSWEHRIIVEATQKPVADWRYPLCVAGERACPPEDVGGPPGYEGFLEAIAKPKHREHDHLLAWVGGVFDPQGFDINAVNRELRRRRL